MTAVAEFSHILTVQDERSCSDYSLHAQYRNRGETYWDEAFLTYCSTDECVLFATHLVDSVHRYSSRPILVFIFETATVPLGWNSRFPNLVVFMAKHCKQSSLTYAQQTFLSAPVNTGVLFEANTLISSGADVYFTYPSQPQLVHLSKSKGFMAPMLWKIGRSRKNELSRRIRRCIRTGSLASSCFAKLSVQPSSSNKLCPNEEDCEIWTALALKQSNGTQFRSTFEATRVFRFCTGLNHIPTAAELVWVLAKQPDFGDSQFIHGRMRSTVDCT